MQTPARKVWQTVAAAAEVHSMKSLSFSASAVIGFVALSGSLLAQNVPPHAPDGGTIQRVQSIDIPSITNAPFTAIVTTEWTRIMPDGSSALMKNHRTVARDSVGRVFQERRFFSPDGDKQVTRLSELDLEDPTLHQLARCMVDTHVCSVYRMNRPASANPPQAPGKNPANGTQWEDLGRRNVDNVDVVGSREVMTIGVGAIGNEKEQPVVKEFWYSPRLGINVTTKRFDPRASAVQNFEVSNINQGEPDARLFQIPAGYRVVQMDPQQQADSR
ncbi:MAG TPA: hypothetical protein VNU92_00410 [Edaphobacter sp.]|nr:hypothetical protein [Edaphobacter sp.]